MRMSFLKRILILGISIVFILTGMPVEAAEKTAPIRWRFQTFLPAGDTNHDQICVFAKKVYEQSGGRLEIKVFAAGEIVPVSAIFNSIKSGTLQGGTIFGAATPQVPVAAVDMNVPFSFQFYKSKEPWNDIRKMLKESGILQVLEEAFAEHGMHLYGFSYAAGFPAIYSKKAIRKVDDVKGMKIFAAGATGKILSHFGAANTRVNITEAYSALKLGTIDGAVYDNCGMFDLSWHEVVKYYILPRWNEPIITSMIVNKAAWDKLPNDLKKIVVECNDKYAFEGAAKIMHATDAKIIEGQKKYGYEVIILPDSEVGKLRDYARNAVWPEFAKKSPRCAKVIDKLNKYYGYK
jgi:TRAP-type C4-dicarboxylate transport system substrate-binding protein